ncbi:hypothetical protein JYU34_018587 [Plutella xylostella]|uniref:Uncharacterized protein n=1 Tax=Plutella xylostella TaxID=51655 RepID=A0ABQ7PXY1_PLUXY|nr:hypothetical protein JYU34_018587 [Plutella xylostella]
MLSPSKSLEDCVECTCSDDVLGIDIPPTNEVGNGICQIKDDPCGGFTPSGEKIDDNRKLDLSRVNRDWNEAYSSSTAKDQVLQRITNDLEYLLDKSDVFAPFLS